MDTITHGLAGALIAKSISSRPQFNRVGLSVVLGSVFPDLDMLGGLFSADELFELEFHRGITHSIVGLPFFALILAALIWRKGERWKLLALGYAVGISSHIFLDLVTSYGTMIFEPLSEKRYTLDTIFIIDLSLSCLVLIPQLVAFAWSKPDKGPRRAWLLWSLTLVGAGLAYFVVNSLGVHLSLASVVAAVSIFGGAFALPGITAVGTAWPCSRYCRIGLAVSVLYVVACAFAHQVALNRVHGLAAKYQLQAVNVAALPAPPSLLRWSGLVETPEGIARFSIALNESREPAVERYVNSTDIPGTEKLHSLPQLQRFLAFARFPWVTARQEARGTLVEYRDLRFLMPARSSGVPFTFQIRLDIHGNLLATQLVGP